MNRDIKEVKTKEQILELLKDSSVNKDPNICLRCECSILRVCDRTKPSVLVEWKGSSHTKSKPTYMWQHPIKEKQPCLCLHCMNQLEEEGLLGVILREITIS